MMKFLYIFIVIFSFVGCSVSRTIDKQLTQVDRTNGLNYQESLIIAQDILHTSSFASDYDVKSGQIIQGILMRDYPNYWFVTFDAKDFRTPFWKFLVVMHKDSGEVVFAEPCVPLDHANFDWVFQPRKSR
jgi:hypothetical protein